VTGTTTPKSAAQRRRRNVVPTAQGERVLPTTGREGCAPLPPVPLGPAGARWWNWAWSTPQATTWTHDGFHETLAKRAQLEDVWTAVGNGEIGGDLTKLLPLMLRIDESFGLTSRAAAQLHLTFAEPMPEVEQRPVSDIRDRLKGLGA
jgi:hypothetical protein